MIDITYSEHIAQQARITLCMYNYVDRVHSLAGSQEAVRARTKITVAVERADGSKRPNDPASDQTESDRGPVERFLSQDSMERNGHRGSGGHQFAETPHDLLRGATQRAIFELYIDTIEFVQPSGNFLDVVVGETLDAFVRGPQQVLVQVEDRNLGVRTKLPFQGPGVTGDAAHFVVRADDREAKRTGSRRSGSIEQARPPICD
jgi:hypothetical protein